MTLTTILRVNAVSCLGFGGLFLAVPGRVSAFLGATPVWLIVALGLGLLANAAHLQWAARRQPRDWEVRYFSLGDAAWVALTLAVLAAGAWVTSPAGQSAAAAVAVGVGALGALQWQALAHRRRA
ncbi:MAG: hypothetical protein GVY27_11100 [Deinococcus-Thermus bacterium]|jgi:cbb3-type cytochrome oxidase subunit 3|nr:hypothetical protein [Deinococcota bacterium]